MVTTLLLAVNLVLHAGGSPCQASTASRKQESPNEQGERKTNPIQRDCTVSADQDQSATESAKFELAEGTAVRLKFVRAVVSSRVMAGDQVALEVAEPVVVNGCVVLRKGSPAEATVTLAQAKRTMARGGNLELKIETIRLADGELVPVRAVKDVKGQGHGTIATTTMIAGSLYGAPLIVPLIVKGKDATVPAGTETTAFVGATVSLDHAKFQNIDAKPPEKKL